MDKQQLRGIILIVISAIGYALMPSLSAFAYAKGYTVSQVLFYRFAISAVIVWGVIIAWRIPWKTSFKHGIYLIAIGFVGYTLCSKVLFMGYQYVSGSVATMILFMHPVFVVLGEAAIEKVRPGKNKIISIVVAMIGLIVILYEKEVSYNLYGLALCFLSAVTYAIYCLGLAEKNTRQMHTLTVTAYVTTLSAVYNFVECLQGGDNLIISDPSGLGIILILAIGGTVIPAVTFFSGLKIVGSGAATIISTVEPAFVYLFEMILLGQTMVAKNIIGGVIIAVAIVMLSRLDQRKEVFDEL